MTIVSFAKFYELIGTRTFLDNAVRKYIDEVLVEGLNLSEENISILKRFADDIHSEAWREGYKDGESAGYDDGYSDGEAVARDEYPLGDD
jgi:hypothetical protein